MDTVAPRSKSAHGRPRCVIVVSTIPVFPSHQGNRVVLRQRLKWFRSLGWRVILVLQATPPLGEWKEHYEEVCDEVRVVLSSKSPRSRLLRVLRRGLGKVGMGQSGLVRKVEHWLQLDRWRVWPETQSLLSRLACEFQPRVVYVQYHYLCPLFEREPFPGVVRVVETHDAWSMVKDKVESPGGEGSSRSALAAQEGRNLRHCDIVVAIQGEEARFFREELGCENVVVTGLACDRAVSGGDHERGGTGKRLLFVGSDNPLNRRGLEWFLEEAWPVVLADHPDAELRVCGSVGRDLGDRGDGVLTLGIVEDLGPEWAAADVFINPVDLGTGLKIKTIEAIARGKPVLAAEEAVAGLPRETPSPFEVAEVGAEFGRRLAALLADPGRVDLMRDAAREYSQRHFSQEAVYRPLKDAIEAVLERKANG